MKKSIIFLVMLLLCAFVLTGCNYKILDTKWTFNYAYISLPDGGIQEVKVDKWSEDSTTITIISEDNIYCIAPINCLLTKNKIDF